MLRAWLIGMLMVTAAAAEREAASAAVLAPFRAQLAQRLADKATTVGAWRFTGHELELLRLDRVPATAERDPLAAIIHLHRQLAARGCALIVAPIPDKAAVMPEVVGDAAPRGERADVAVQRFLADLTDAGVATIDLEPRLRAARAVDAAPLYYERDIHWRNRACRIAAAAIAERLGAAPVANPWRATPFERVGDSKADHLTVITTADGAAWAADAAADVVITGDSYALYHQHLGGHLPAQVAFAAGRRVDALMQEGLWGQLPLKLIERDRTTPGWLTGKRTIVFTFITRALLQGAWPLSDLPTPAAAAPAMVAGFAAAEVVVLAPAPAADGPYADGVRHVLVRDLRGADGTLIGDGRAIVRLHALRQRRPLPAAALIVGQRIAVHLTPLDALSETQRSWQATLLDPADEAALPSWWGELMP